MLQVRNPEDKLHLTQCILHAAKLDQTSQAEGRDPNKSLKSLIYPLFRYADDSDRTMIVRRENLGGNHDLGFTIMRGRDAWLCGGIVQNGDIWEVNT